MKAKAHKKLTLDKTIKRVEKYDEYVNMDILNKYGMLGVKALYEHTPKRTGLTASSWTYSISISPSTVSLNFKNTNIQNGVPIAIMIEYGHATPHGGWVEGRPYINKALNPVLKDMLAEIRERKKSKGGR